MKKFLNALDRNKAPLFLTAGLLAVGAWFALPSTAGLGDYDLAQTPLYVGNPEPPLMMIVMSRDEQMFNKAYTDYTDLDNDGVIDTTYNDKFDYAGYFDSKLCYNYSSSTFVAASQAGGSNGHSCSGRWSGNFLNWVTMSRMDVMRYVLYGGKRSTDSTSSTVLERSYIPNDLHSWVKVYSKTDISSFTPLSGASSFCNTSLSKTGAPLMRVAGGSFTEWAATAASQCQLKGAAVDAAKNDVPSSATDYTVRVNVCSNSNETLRENYCRNYSNGTTSIYKPAGLLQEYGESGRIKFGLLTGSAGSPRGGGVLRRNIGLFAGNSTTISCSADDEINLLTGQFCAKTGAAEGIIRTIENLTLDQWSGSTWSDCNNYAILNRQGQTGSNGNLNNPGSSGNGSYNCSGWGNPLAEMYAEALRYITGATTATSNFTTGTDISNMPSALTWKDPYRPISQGGSTYCAACSILVLSSGLPSFDSDEIPSVSGILGAESATNAVGSAEGIGGKNYFAGRITATPKGTALNTHSDTCKSFAVSQLGSIRGLCPDSPSTEGSFLISGLAHQAQTKNLRPTLTTGTNAQVNVKTYGVQLAENMPTFKVPVGGSSISLSPLCQSNNTGTATATSDGWRTCFLGSVGVGKTQSNVNPKHVYGRDLEYSGNQVVAGSYKLTWEDSLWGNDHDNDVVSVMTFCVGAKCNDKTNPANTTKVADICWRSTSTPCTGPFKVEADDVLVRIEVISAYAGNALLTGMTVTGANTNGTFRDFLRPGSKDSSLISTVGNPDDDNTVKSWSKPQVYRFKAGSGATGLLENPLWYAVKYGNFNDTNGDGLPSAGEWDSKNPGTPDGYFLSRNPNELKQRLSDIFKNASGGGATVAGSGNGARINSQSFSVYATYSVDRENNWTGNLIAERIKKDGTQGDVLWNAGNRMNAMSANSRNIVMVKTPTRVNASNALVPAVSDTFATSNLPGSTTADKLSSIGMDTLPQWYTDSGLSLDTLVSYLKGNNVTQMRFRGNKLGDIVNSSPEIVVGTDDYGYTSWGKSTNTALKSLGDSYKSYLTTKTNRTPMVYIGANDGMLHGFNASQTGGGGEEFAFIPHSARQHLSELANPKYTHKYYVDGPLTSSDVYTGSWKSVLIGTTGAGGYTSTQNSNRIPGGSVFALDVSNPTAFTKSHVMWELNSNDDIELGYVIGTPKIVPVKIGTSIKFIALFGNGLNSNNGTPVLYAVDVSNGKVLKKIKPSGNFVRNGLINIAPIAKNNADGLVDTVYGGDMQGNMWKFDLSSGDINTWAVSFNNTPLFSAVDEDDAPQPITGEIEVISGPNNGQLVYFGTGRYLLGSDITDTSVQSLYAVLDNNSSVVGGRASLVQQRITSSGTSARTISSNPVAYTTKRGWFIDLKARGGVGGERFIGRPTTQSGNVYFVTYTPTQAGCSGAVGINWLYGLSAISGEPMLNQSSTGDSSNGQLCTENCGALSLTNISSTVSPAPIKTSDVFIPSLADKCDDGSCTRDELLSAQQCSFVLNIAGASNIYLPRACGRQSWRQIQ